VAGLPTADTQCSISWSGLRHCGAIPADARDIIYAESNGKLTGKTRVS
jgi:hypothetical protein